MCTQFFTFSNSSSLFCGDDAYYYPNANDAQVRLKCVAYELSLLFSRAYEALTIRERSSCQSTRHYSYATEKNKRERYDILIYAQNVCLCRGEWLPKTERRRPSNKTSSSTVNAFFFVFIVHCLICRSNRIRHRTIRRPTQMIAVGTKGW